MTGYVGEHSTWDVALGEPARPLLDWDQIRALRDEAFDLLHVHEPLAPGPTITAIVMKQTPIVATYHRAGESRAR